MMKSRRAPQARKRGRAVVDHQLAVRGHHAPAIVLAPYGVEKRIPESRRVTGPRDGEKPRVLVIQRLHREHNAALDQVLPYMRGIAFRQSFPAPAPLARTITPLVERRTQP